MTSNAVAIGRVTLRDIAHGELGTRLALLKHWTKETVLGNYKQRTTDQKRRHQIFSTLLKIM